MNIAATHQHCQATGRYGEICDYLAAPTPTGAAAVEGVR